MRISPGMPGRYDDRGTSASSAPESDGRCDRRFDRAYPHREEIGAGTTGADSLSRRRGTLRSITSKRATFSLDRHARRTNGSLWLARALAMVDDGARASMSFRTRTAGSDSPTAACTPRRTIGMMSSPSFVRNRSATVSAKVGARPAPRGRPGGFDRGERRHTVG